MGSHQIGSGDFKTRRSRIRFLYEGVEGLVVAVLAILTWPLSKRWLTNWGSFSAEREIVWPGDRFVKSNHDTVTRAISIEAPSELVWRWLVQFGYGRAGFYSYELLERLVGIPVVNVESILPEEQSLEEGSEILLHPKSPGIPIGLIEEGKYICFGKDPDSRQAEFKKEPARSWSMYIEPATAVTSRLVLRSCIEPANKEDWSQRFSLALGVPIDFVMEQRMLRTLKRLAEWEYQRKRKALIEITPHVSKS